MRNAPLWMPDGSVRAILALALVGALIAGVAEVREIVLVVVGFYFGTRSTAASGPEGNQP